MPYIASEMVGDMGDLTKNFDSQEFKCPCCGKLLLNGKLPVAIQVLRDNINKPIHVHSGYRCPDHNKGLTNSSKKSQHMLGNAVDFHADGLTPLQLFRAAEKIRLLASGGLGLYDWGIHADLRGTRARWGEVDGHMVSIEDALEHHEKMKSV